MIGHTRYATTGAITEENAHPIIKKNIVGVHNGMVHNYGYLGDFKVDSEAIFYLLSEFDGDAEKALPMLDGVFAIAWFDQISKSISIIRDHNPLFVLETQDGYFFDSQAKTIRALKDIYGGVAYDLDTNKLWTFKIGKDTCEAVGKKVIIGSDPYKPEGIISIKIGHRTVEFDFLNAKKVTDRNVKCEACGKKSRHKVTQFFEDAKTVLCEPCVDKYLERSNNE
jgi:asparagine synthetase B (glutamine-hydrolysing)